MGAPEVHGPEPPFLASFNRSARACCEVGTPSSVQTSFRPFPGVEAAAQHEHFCSLSWEQGCILLCPPASAALFLMERPPWVFFWELLWPRLVDNPPIWHGKIQSLSDLNFHFILCEVKQELKIVSVMFESLPSLPLPCLGIYCQPLPAPAGDMSALDMLMCPVF